MTRVIVRMNRSPFYQRPGPGVKPGIPKRITQKMINARVTREQSTMIWDAHIWFRKNMVSWLAGYRRRGALSSNQFEHIRQFIRLFIFTPRTEKGREIYRAPTREELESVFPLLQEVLKGHHQASKTLKRQAKFRP